MERLLRRAYRHLSTAPGWSVPAVAMGAAILLGIAMIALLTAGGVQARSGLPGGGTPGSSSPAPSSPAPSSPAPSGAGSAASQFRGIILPDLLIVSPHGLTGAAAARLGAITGVRDLITFDGAQLEVAGRPVSVIGVSAAQFRSWVPLRTASDQALWSGLAAGDFIASQSAAAALGLAAGGSYPLSGAATLSVPFGGAARLGISGVDLLVNQAISRKLGLVHRVAALISAPGLSLASLTARVQRILGPDARTVRLRSEQLPVTTAQPAQIGGYLQLFQDSAARYCPNLSWTVLAAIGQIESGDGRNVGPSTAGALGPMQFLPSTWAAWGIDGFGQTGPPDILNALDAVPSAARLLCADGARTGTQAALRQAIFSYNHADWYVNAVLALAAQYASSYR